MSNNIDVHVHITITFREFSNGWKSMPLNFLRTYIVRKKFKDIPSYNKQLTITLFINFFIYLLVKPTPGCLILCIALKGNARHFSGKCSPCVALRYLTIYSHVSSNTSLLINVQIGTKVLIRYHFCELLLTSDNIADGTLMVAILFTASATTFSDPIICCNKVQNCRI